MWQWARNLRWPLWGSSLTQASPTHAIGPSLATFRSKGPSPVPLSYRLLDGQDTHPPIVFLHGLFSNKNIFQSEAEALAQKTGRKVLTVDARNHGDSPHNPDCSYEAMSADLQALLPKLGLAPCVLIGHSFGGKIAMMLALQKVDRREVVDAFPALRDIRVQGQILRTFPHKCPHLSKPELVERLVSVDISPFAVRDIPNIFNIIPAMKSLKIPVNLSPSQAFEEFNEQLKQNIQDPIIRQYLFNSLIWVNGQYVWKVNAENLWQQKDQIMDSPEIRGVYQGPTLFLKCTNSSFLPPSHYPKIKHMFPETQIQKISGAGHIPHIEKPQEFMNSILSFLS